MLAPLLDHLTSIVVGAIIIVTLLIIQTRDRQGGVVDTINHTVRVQLYQAMEPLDDDIPNMKSPEAAHGFTGTSTGFSWGVDTLASGLTRSFTFPAAVLQDNTTMARVYGQVEYELSPNGGTVVVGGVPQALHTLVRKVDYSVVDPSRPSDLDTLSRSLTDFRMGFVSGVVSDNTVWEGSAEDATHSIHLSVTAARPAPESMTQDLDYVGFENAVSHGTVYSPTGIR